MYVKDWMTKNVISIPSDATVAEARVLFESRSIRHLPVIEEGRVIGLFTHTDQLKVREDHQMTVVKQWMTSGLITVEPGATIEAAAIKLRQHKIGCLPVVGDDGGLVGILTESDVFDLLVDLLGFRSGGARLVLETSGDSLATTVDRLVELVREHQMTLRSIVFYHPRGADRPTHVVARVGGAET
jgi:acetoin utilization protein AcuB